MDKIPLSNKTSVAVSVGSDVTVLTQTRVNMTCEAEGVPKPKLTWLRDGQPVRSEVNSSLVLTITTLEDAGQVTCFAENLAGNTTLSTDIGVIGKEACNTKKPASAFPGFCHRFHVYKRRCFSSQYQEFQSDKE